MTNCDREDFDFHYTFELRNGVLVKLNIIDEIVAEWALEEAPEEELYAALDELRPKGDYSDDLSVEELIDILRKEL